jgi:hypothetical protein
VGAVRQEEDDVFEHPQDRLPDKSDQPASERYRRDNNPVARRKSGRMHSQLELAKQPQLQFAFRLLAAFVFADHRRLPCPRINNPARFTSTGLPGNRTVCESSLGGAEDVSRIESRN